MPVLTFVARVMDGLLLVASMDSGSDSAATVDVCRSQAKQILKRLNPRSVAKCSIESRPYVFHYMIDQGICYLTLAEKGYPKRLAFLYLEEIHQEFVGELRQDYGEEWRNKASKAECVETAARPYAFIKFDKVIQRKRKEFLDPQSRNNMARLNDDLADIHSIMKQNIEEVLNRGEKLDHVSEISKSLSTQAEQFKWSSKKLSLMAMWQKYGPIGAMALAVILILWWKFF
ncbi:unnamed protein product [Pylaiella littoralis]